MGGPGAEPHVIAGLCCLHALPGAPAAPAPPSPSATGSLLLTPAAGGVNTYVDHLAGAATRAVLGLRAAAGTGDRGRTGDERDQ